jgi:hypothetical protein
VRAAEHSDQPDIALVESGGPGATCIGKVEVFEITPTETERTARLFFTLVNGSCAKRAADLPGQGWIKSG